MATKIQWTEETWNPIGGCQKVSPGCNHCYAIGVAHRLGGNPNAKIRNRYEGLTQIEGGKPNWSGKTFIDEKVLLQPFKRRKPTTYFISLSDLFYTERSDEDIDRVFAVMALCPQHAFQILTKYEERMHSYLTGRGGQYNESAQIRIMKEAGERDSYWENADEWDEMLDRQPWPLPNVHLGVSVENQEYADKRIPLLLKTPAALRFISYEPALGPVDFYQYLGGERNPIGPAYGGKGLDWVIFGFESGPSARPGKVQWSRTAKDQCVTAGVPFFLKQYADDKGRKIGTPELDGQQWMQMPA